MAALTRPTEATDIIHEKMTVNTTGTLAKKNPLNSFTITVWIKPNFLILSHLFNLTKFHSNIE